MLDGTLDWFSNCKPRAPKALLHIVAGSMWAGVGIMLMWFAYQWLKDVELIQYFWFSFAGILLAYTIYLFGFSKLANKNIGRIEDIQSEKPCIFAFQQWTSYPLILVMISMGIYLRKFSPLPKVFLASLYIGIGGSLFLASSHYLKKLWKR